MVGDVLFVSLRLISRRRKRIWSRLVYFLSPLFYNINRSQGDVAAFFLAGRFTRQTAVEFHKPAIVFISSVIIDAFLYCF